jgi:glutathione S-transferase
MKLHGDLISPFVRMSMVTALEAGLGGRVQLVQAGAKPHEVNAALEKLSPIGKIPILETDHGHPIYDSRVIMEYLCHSAGNTTLLPHEGVARFKILTLQALSIGLAEASVGLRYEQAARPQGLQWADWMTRVTARINASLDALDGEWNPSLQDAHLGSIATAVVLSYIDYRHPNLNWRKNRMNLTQFHKAFSTRDSMVNTALPLP